MLFKSSLLLSRFLMLVLFLIGTNVFAHESHLLLKASNRNIEITALVEGYQSDDFRNKKSERHYFATDTATQKRYEIHFDKKAPKHFKAGNVLKLSGKLVGETDLF